MDLAEQGQQLRILGSAAQRVDHHPLGRAGAIVLHQVAGVADRFGRTPVGRLDRAGELLAGQFARALALVGQRHHRQRLGVARRLGQRGTHVLHRLLGTVGVDRQLGAQLERADMVAVLGQHGFEQRRARLRLAGLGQHAGKAGLQVAGLVRGVGALDKAAHRRDRRVGVAFGEVERGAGAPERPGIGGGGDQPVELGSGGPGAADVVEKAHQRQRPLRIGRDAPGVRGRPQHRFGRIGIALAEVPLHQRGADAVVGREQREHASEFGAGAGRVAERLERGEAGEVQSFVAFGIGEGGVDPRQRLDRGAGGEPVGDQHHLCRDRAGLLGDHARGHCHRGRAVVTLAEVDGGLQRPHLRICRREAVGLGRVQRGGVEVADLERECGQRALTLEVLRILFGEAQQLAERLAVLAARAQQLGIAQPRHGMGAVEPEHVAEFEHRPRLVALGQQRQRPLVVALGPFRRAVAPGQRQQGDQQQARPEQARPGGPGNKHAPKGRDSKQAPAGPGDRPGSGENPAGARTGAHRTLRLTGSARRGMRLPRRDARHRPWASGQEAVIA